MKKQTAVELAKNNIEGEALAFIDGFLTFNEFMDNINKCFQQALEIEKQQIIDAYGVKVKHSIEQGTTVYTRTFGEQYYNEKFK